MLHTPHTTPGGQLARAQVRRNRYDANGHLVAFADTATPANNKTWVNDAQGIALMSGQGGQL